MKKIIITIIVFSYLVVMSACSYKGYSGEHTDLYTVAVNSLLWNNGHSWGTEWAIDSEIDIIETDSYGRVIFTYREEFYAGAGISFSSMLISQTTADGYVYYYEDVNFIIMEQESYSSKTNVFSKKSVDLLKSVNDWGKEMNISKCIKKEVNSKKTDIPLDKKDVEKMVKDYFGIDGNNIFVHYLTEDSLGNVIIYGCSRGENYIYFVILLDSDDGKKFLVPSDCFDYKDELIAFKLLNGWGY